MATLYLMLGYPGAGKTTTAETITLLTGAVHLQSDRFRLALYPNPKFTSEEHQAVYGGLDYLTKLLLATGVSVVYDANLNHFKHRKEKYDICEATNAQAILLWVKTDKSLAKIRATQQASNDPRRPYGNLATNVFERLTEEIEPPKTDEHFIEIDGTKVTPLYISEKLGIKT